MREVEMLIAFGVTLFLFPALLCLFFEYMYRKRTDYSGSIWINVLASYGIYFILVSTFAAISESIDTYLQNNCVPLVRGAIPCAQWIYEVGEFVASWLFVISIAVALLAQIFYLLALARHVAFNKHKQPTR